MDGKNFIKFPLSRVRFDFQVFVSHLCIFVMQDESGDRMAQESVGWLRELLGLQVLGYVNMN